MFNLTEKDVLELFRATFQFSPRSAIRVSSHLPIEANVGASQDSSKYWYFQNNVSFAAASAQRFIHFGKVRSFTFPRVVTAPWQLLVQANWVYAVSATGTISANLRSTKHFGDLLFVPTLYNVYGLDEDYGGWIDYVKVRHITGVGGAIYFESLHFFEGWKINW